MTKLEELERAIDNLPEEEYRRFRRWFMEKDWERWDREIAEDSRVGKLDFLLIPGSAPVRCIFRGKI